MAMTISDMLERTADAFAAAGQPIRLEYRNACTTKWDVKVISNSSEALLQVAGRVPESKMFKRVSVKGNSALVEFNDDDVMQEVERRLAGLPIAGSGFRGKRIVVQFIDPNSTKALHLGHLYEAILGNALAALLEDRGAAVRRSCFVSDISRSVCEAMAGYEKFGEQATPKQRHEKPDHLVGRVYAQYAAAYYKQHPAELDNEDPTRRETALVGDEADDYVRRYQAGDRAARDLWLRIRNWVLEGQMATLERLGVRLDTVQYGSDTDDIIAKLLDDGLQHGVLQREPSGAIVYHSGKEEYKVVVMTRPDGFPTEHARQMAQVISVQAACATEVDRYYTLMGMEWKPAWQLYENVLRGCGDGDSPYHDIVVPVCHGMVMVEGSKMKSSLGAVVLADEFVDRVEALGEIQALSAATDGRVPVSAIADVVVKSFFLSRRVNRDLSFSWNHVTSAADNPGWEIATAWCAVNSPCDAASARSPALDLDLVRTLLFKSFDLERAFNFAASETDLTLAIKALVRFAALVNGAVRDQSDGLAIELSRCILHRGMASLGIACDRPAAAAKVAASAAAEAAF